MYVGDVPRFSNLVLCPATSRGAREGPGTPEVDPQEGPPPLDRGSGTTAEEIVRLLQTTTVAELRCRQGYAGIISR